MAKIEWKGGECPVSGDTLVRIWLKGSDSLPEATAIEYAGEFYWTLKNDVGDIIAYEVIEEAKEEPKQITEKTLRDEFAMAWLEKFPRDGKKVDEISSECYDMADAMMKARAK